MSEIVETIHLDVAKYLGHTIYKVIDDAIALAKESGRIVTFNFNEVPVSVDAADTQVTVVDRWDKAREAKHQAWINSEEYKQQQKDAAEKARAKREAVFSEPANTETEMYEAKVPWPETEQQLVDYINSLINKNHSYGTCVYAASMASEAVFNYVSNVLGMTGFQASCADLDFLRRTRLMKGPFILIKAEDLLYPQYRIDERLTKFRDDSLPWLKEEAVKKIAEEEEFEDGFAHPDVLQQWKDIVNM